MRYILMAVLIGWFITTAKADNADGKFNNAPNRDWYQAQEINPEARTRLNVSWKSCCNNSDVVKTRFRVDRTTAADQWWYLDDNTWRQVPADIIHWNDPTPDGQPILFVYSGKPTCFYPGDSGG